MNDLLHSYGKRQKIKVIFISNYCLVSDSIKNLFETTRDIAVVVIFLHHKKFSTTLNQIDADIIVIYFEKDDDLTIISDIQTKQPETRVVAIIDSKEIENQLSALKMGAAGIVKKEQSFKFLFEAVRQTSKGEVWFDQTLLSRILMRDNNKKSLTSQFCNSVEIITSRENQVIQMIGEGLKNKQIADRLCISEATVRHHLSSIYGKLGIEDRLNLVILAYQKGLIKISENHRVGTEGL